MKKKSIKDAVSIDRLNNIVKKNKQFIEERQETARIKSEKKKDATGKKTKKVN